MGQLERVARAVGRAADAHEERLGLTLHGAWSEDFSFGLVFFSAVARSGAEASSNQGGRNIGQWSTLIQDRNQMGMGERQNVCTTALVSVGDAELRGREPFRVDARGVACVMVLVRLDQRVRGVLHMQQHEAVVGLTHGRPGRLGVQELGGEPFAVAPGACDDVHSAVLAHFSIVDRMRALVGVHMACTGKHRD